MSTKIYDAFRIKKNIDILSTLNKAREFFTEYVSQDKGLLYSIHAETTYAAVIAFEENEENVMAKNVIVGNDNNTIDTFWIERCLEKYAIGMEKKISDIKISCSIFYDSDYWYIKVFVNNNWTYKPLEDIAKKYGWEDYHYQNQVDPPEDIPDGEFEKRIEMWDKLLGEEGNYRGGFNFDLFDAYEFRKLISKNYYRGFKTNDELYSHLAYKFDKKLSNTI